MSENTSIVFTGGTLPEGFCYPSSPQVLFNQFVALLSGYLPGTSNTFNYGNTIPDPDDRNKPWLRLDGSGNPDRWYVFNNGLWISLHPVPASSSIIMWWEGTLDDLKTLDGGVDEAVTATTGPFWQEVTTMQGRFPVHPGTLDMTTSTVVGVGDTGGVAKITLTTDQIPSHHHQLNNLKEDRMSRDDLHVAAFAGSGNPKFGETTTPPTINTADTGGGSAHDNVPPYRGIYAIKRTARIYYKV